MLSLLSASGWDNFTAGFTNFTNTLKTFFESGLGKIALFFIVAIIGFIAIKIFIRFLKNLGKKIKLDQTVYKFLVTVIKFVLWVLYVLTLLAIVGVPITSLVAVITALTLGITLAIQSSVSNIANGIVLLANKPFKIGDFVEISGVSGTVEDISIFNTKIRTGNNEIITMPHNVTINNPIIDYTSLDMRRIVIDVSVSYDSDVDKVKEILKDVIKEQELVLQDQANSVNLAKMNSSSIDFSVKVWTATENYWDCFFAMTEGVFKKLNENNIEIPYNKLDVLIKSNEPKQIEIKDSKKKD
ncbi:MAG: mechanosensitive ion channel family protein [Clostridia bacterium]|nr:mechanosensitive ion channel family protein [Clostridia bacterium]